MQAPQPILAEEAEVMDATAGATKADGEDFHEATAAFKTLQPSQHGGTSKTTIVLKTHDGHGYILPVLPWEASLQDRIHEIRH